MTISSSSTWPDRDPSGGSLDLLGRRDQPWTAAAALDLLPQNNGPRIEVLSGCVIVTPGTGVRRIAISRT
ncbi:hypothetical protein [Micromonospora sp. WMMD1219]|uniref:hypothetical protein n=1 Tax=Micromonospora sp. WMMD1219 TaxID=3404115 RepID=UPI003BF4C283